MTERYSTADLIAAVERLTPDRLDRFLHLRIVVPAEPEPEPAFRRIDVERLTLLCELTEDFELNEDALVIVMSLIDQLHGTRARMDALLAAIRSEPRETKLRLSQSLHLHSAEDGH